MKNALILFIISFILISACKKDNFIHQDNSSFSSSSLKSTEDSLTQVKIFNFMERMDLVRDDPEYEDSENWNYSTDSTIWYIEASLNIYFSYYYYYSNESESNYISNLDSTEISIDIGEDGYNIVEIQETYDLFSDYLDDYYDEIEDEDKFFVLIDIDSIESDTMKARFVFGIAQELPESVPAYYWGWALGLCTGGNQGTDAADILEFYLNGPYPAYPNPIISNYYYSSVSTTDEIRPPDVPTTPHSYGDKMLFEDYQEVTLIHHCIGVGEFGTWYDFLQDIAADNIPLRPNGVNVINYYVFDDTAYGLINGNDFWSMQHVTQITYGLKKVCTEPPPTP